MLTRIRGDREKLHLGLMLALTFSTGTVDAIGYLGLDKVFAGNMTGNVVILGMAIAGAPGLPWVGPLLALFAFMLGAVIGGRVLRPVAAGWTHRTTSVFFVVGILLALIAIAFFVLAGKPEEPGALVLTVFLAIAMGLQAACARHIAVKDVTTVVVTSTITGFAADSRLAGGRGQPWFRRGMAIVLIAIGALVGALLLPLHIGWGIALAAAITLAVALIGHTPDPVLDPAPPIVADPTPDALTDPAVP